ncbi:hypothetical protein [uncultured Slackia sp.]|uniref:hypothetical protein n=1 Tax=uncultured Slackia sp. TaxID=665903 RepID=UPI0025DD4EEE|nr:hypothetical protein [uncultured Slackia sp.]
MYKTVVVKYCAKAKEMAEQVEKVSNQMAQEGYELVTFSTMPSAKGILVFKESGTADDAVDNEADAE